MKYISILLVLILNATDVWAVGGGEGGGQETNGGDGFVAEYLHVFDSIMNMLPNKTTLMTGQVIHKDALIKSRLLSRYSSAESLILESVEKGALNQPFANPPNITISRTFWRGLGLEGKRLLALHEQLFVAGYDDSNYFYSSALYNRLVNGMAIEQKILTTSIVTCDKDFFDGISLADFDVSFSKDAQSNALYLATTFGCADFLKLWIQWGKNVNICTLHTPLSSLLQSTRIKSFYKRYSLAKILILAGALPNLECSLREQAACKIASTQFLHPEDVFLRKLMKCK